jgi:hypothetical protein
VLQGAIFREFCLLLPKLLPNVLKGKIKGELEVTGRRGRRRKKLLDDFKDRR